MNQRTDRILLASIALLAGALIWVVTGTLDQRVINVGDAAPKFTVTTDRGLKITPTDFGGKILVLNFWATWCATCLVEMPSLDAFDREFAKQGVVVLGISVDKNEKLYRRFLDRQQFAFETARDPEAEIGANYGTFQYPETYIIDRSGTVVEKLISNQNWMDPEFVARIRRML